MSMFMLMCMQKGDGNENSQIAGSDDTSLPGLARKEATKAGISVGELVRTRCEQRVGDETALAELTALLRKEVTATRATVRRNLDETRAILRDLRARRKTESVEDRA